MNRLLQLFLILMLLLSLFSCAEMPLKTETQISESSDFSTVTDADLGNGTETAPDTESIKESAKETETESQPQPTLQVTKRIEEDAMTVLTCGGSKAIAYDSSTGENNRDYFTAELSLDCENWHPVAIYSAPTRTKDAKTGKYENHITYFTSFDLEGTAFLRIHYTRTVTGFQSRLRPSIDADSVAVIGQSEVIRIDKPCQLSYEVNGDIYSNLHIFVSPIEEVDRDDPNILYLAPGVYAAENCSYFEDGFFVVPKGKTVYLAGGAVIRGGVHFKNNQNAAIRGRGMVDMYGLDVGNKASGGVRIEFCSDITVEGIMIRDANGYSVYGGSTDGLLIDNIKVISFGNYSDGFDCMACNHVTIRNSFFRTNDDCIAIYGSRWNNFGSSRHFLIENCVLFADNAHAINIGNHGSSDKNNPDTIEDIIFRDVDVLEVHSTYYTGVICFQNGGENIIKNITFEDIRIDDFTLSDLVRMHFIKDNNAYGGSISDITFRNVCYTDAKPKKIYLLGRDEERAVRNIIFDNLVINGIKVTKDTAGLEMNQYVYHVKFS